MVSIENEKVFNRKKTSESDIAKAITDANIDMKKVKYSGIGVIGWKS